MGDATRCSAVRRASGATAPSMMPPAPAATALAPPSPRAASAVDAVEVVLKKEKRLANVLPADADADAAVALPPAGAGAALPPCSASSAAALSTFTSDAADDAKGRARDERADGTDDDAPSSSMEASFARAPREAAWTLLPRGGTAASAAEMDEAAAALCTDGGAGSNTAGRSA